MHRSGSLDRRDHASTVTEGFTFLHCKCVCACVRACLCMCVQCVMVFVVVVVTIIKETTKDAEK